MLGFPITVAPIGNAGLLQPVTDYPQNIWLSDEGTGTQKLGKDVHFHIETGPMALSARGDRFLDAESIKM